MSIADALARSANKPAGKRPYFLDRSVERVLAITMAVLQELAVTRERLDTVERLLERGGALDRSAIDAFEPTADQAAERSLWLQEYIARTLRILQQEAEAAEQEGATE